MDGVSARLVFRLGLHLEALRAQGKPVVQYLMSQLCQLVLLYMMYEASQLMWGYTFYSKSKPEGLEVALYTWMLLGEYYSLVRCPWEPDVL